MTPQERPARCDFSDLYVRECAHCQGHDDSGIPRPEVASYAYGVVGARLTAGFAILTADDQ